jgi:hypothetical protein
MEECSPHTTVNAWIGGEFQYPASPTLTAQASARRTLHPAQALMSDSPSKHNDLMTSALASTSSGAFLVSQQKLISAQAVFEPIIAHVPSPSNVNWCLLDTHPLPEFRTNQLADLKDENTQLKKELQLAREHIKSRDELLGSQYAQLVLQNFHLRKQNEVLHAKEEKKKNPTDRTRLMGDRMPRVLTADEFVDEVRKADEATLTRDEEKASRARRCADKKIATAALESRWREMKQQHKEKVTRWAVECQKLSAERVPKKAWPKKPLRPRKPTIEVIMDDDDERDSESEGSENE